MDVELLAERSKRRRRLVHFTSPHAAGVTKGYIMASLLALDLVQIANRWPDLAADLRAVDGLSGVLSWAVAKGLPVNEMDIITQDEYTHDAVLLWSSLYLVFDVT
jgi:hypothetical protein